ncbi:MAG: hypothetical protein GWN79_23065 [Actinobacteria bacterium]|nr:hypothetical protein [Actinomycetota bacterium]NIT98133.1 hypothetical protein [Actinomycetota bacterium]NIU21761.1 hypothetical protein [Actinomycetota bacterium]NIU70121.1 hypothetical protein [Actinomycetota bacterium]NIV58292.1 hypothetical protein [Actinomycetota bacterium]
MDEDYVPRSCSSGEPGICAAGTSRCMAGAELCDADRLPETELCFDGLDNDCDGRADYPEDGDCEPVSRRLTIRAESDDVEERLGSGGAVLLKSADLHLVEDDVSLLAVALRFGGVDVPPGSTILSASIQFVADGETSGPAQFLIEGEASDDAAPFTKLAGNVSARARTVAKVSWAPPAWTNGEAGPPERTPDLTAIVQEIVDRPGWRSGGSLAFVVSGDGYRTAHAYRGVPERAARLELDYVPPAL